MVSLLEETAVRRFTVEEYYRMAKVGVLSPDERVELIDGIICKMSGEGSRHVAAIELALDTLNDRLKGRHRARGQHPLTVCEDTELVPDIALVPESDPRAYVAGHPRTALLVIEAAETSLRKDLRVKPQAYARADVPEYWVVNLVDDTLEVFRELVGGQYRERLTLHKGEKIRLTAVPDIEVEVTELLP